MVNDIRTRAEGINRINSTPLLTSVKKMEKWIGWTFLVWAKCKLNTNGASKRSGDAGAGGVIRNHKGNWLLGFAMNIGSYSVTTSELWGLYQGLQLAWHDGIRFFEVEVNSLCVTQLISNPMES